MERWRGIGAAPPTNLRLLYGDVLLIIDAQRNMFGDEPAHDSEVLLGRLVSLVDTARANQVPVIFVRNNGSEGDSDVAGSPGWELHPKLQPTDAELLVDKCECNSFTQPALKEKLRELEVDDVLIAGLQSDWCIDETASAALAEGFRPHHLRCPLHIRLA